MKRIVYLLLAFLYTLNNVLAYSPTCSTVGSLPYGASWTAPNKVLGTQVLGNDNILLTPIDTICGTDLPLLPGKADNETITGTWSFSSSPAFSSGAPPTSTNECDASGELCPYQSVVRDTGDQTITGTKTFSTSPVLSEECNATGDACAYESVVRDTGTQTIAGDKTFSGSNTFDTAITQGAAASSANHLMRKAETDTAISAVTAGGCSFSTSAPSSGCTAGACHNRFTSSGIVAYVCTSGGGWVESNADAVSKAVAYTGAVTISSSGSLTVTGDNSFTGTHTVVGNAAFSSSGVTFQSPTAGSNPVTLTYFNANAPYVKQFVQTTLGTFTGTAQAFINGAGVGTTIVPANTFAAGSVLKIIAKGVVTSNSASPSFIFTIDKNSLGNTFWTFSLPNYASAPTDQPFEFEGYTTILTAGAGGTIAGGGNFTRLDSAGTTNIQRINSTGTSSIDTTVTNEFKPTLRASAGTNSATLSFFSIEVIK